MAVQLHYAIVDVQNHEVYDLGDAPGTKSRRRGSLLGWRRGSKVESTFEAKVAHYVDYEVDDHKPFNWNRYYVGPDFIKKIGHYEEPDFTKKTGHYGFSNYHEAKDYVDYMPMK